MAPSQEPKSLPRGRTWILIVADMVAIAAALAITYSVAEAVASPSIIAPTWLTLLLAVLVLPVWVAIFTAYNLYERQNRSISLATFDEVGELFHALIAGSLFFLILSQVLRRVMEAEVFFPVEAAMFLATALPLVLLTRGSVRSWLLPAIMQPRRTLIVGTGDVAQMVERKISAHPEYRLDLVGFVDDQPHGEGTAPLVGRPADLSRLVDELEIDWVILAFSRASYEDTLELLRGARRPDVHLSIVPRFFEVFASNATIQELEGMPIVNLPPMRLSRGIRLTKRVVDMTVAGLGLLLLSPLLALIAVAVKLDSRGPVVLPAGAPRARRQHLPDRQVPHHARGRGERAGRAGAAQRDLGSALQDEGRPARDPRGRPAPAHEPRRAAAAVERAEGRDEPRRPAPVRGPRVLSDHRLGQPQARHHARASPASGRCSGAPTSRSTRW